MSLHNLHPEQPLGFIFTPADATCAKVQIVNGQEVIDQRATSPLASPSPARGGDRGGVLARKSDMPRFARHRRHTVRARRMRKDPTLAEFRLWRLLCDEQLGLSFRRQHPVSGYYLDFYAPAVFLAVEVDGGQHALDIVRDTARTLFLGSKGITVLRFWNNEVLETPEGVCLAIRTVVKHLAARTPTLSLPLAGGGDASPDVPLEFLRLTIPEYIA